MVTIKDVARKSGFSIATVSAVVNGLSVVSLRAKAQIESAIQELGYRPNNVARSLKNSKTSSIAFIVRDITNPFYSEVILGLEDVAWSNNYEVYLCNTENDSEREKKYIENLIGRRVDGVVIATAFNKRGAHYDKLLENGIPYVYLNRRPEEMLQHEYFVGSDNALASEKAVLHLAEQGHKDIMYISGPLNLFTFKKRYEGFVNTMTKLGFPIADNRIVCLDNFDEKSGYEQAQRILGYDNLPEAIFCSSDLLAFGVYQAFRESAIRIPEDISLMGLDNNRYSHLIELSTVEPQPKQMGRTACDVLIDILKNNNANHSREIILEPDLMIRKSCGKGRVIMS